MSKTYIIKKGIMQIFGMLFFGFGVAFVVLAGAGASPLDAVANYSSVLSNFGTQGDWTFIWNVIFAITVFALTRKKKIFITIIISFIIKYFIDFGIDTILYIFPNIDFYGSQQTIRTELGLLPGLLTGSIGLVLLSIGIGSLLANDLFLTPYDELSVYIEGKVGKYSVAKSILDGTSLLVALVLGFIIKTPFAQIYVFSIVVVFGLGPLIALFIRIFTKYKIIDKKNLERNYKEEIE